jgi:hypothetical protein
VLTGNEKQEIQHVTPITEQELQRETNTRPRKPLDKKQRSIAVANHHTRHASFLPPAQILIEN